MSGRASPVAKVTALITRPGADGAELLVFEHPTSGVQLPAGTVEPGESFADASMREAWEETGALGLELVAEVATSATRWEARRVFHLRCTVAMPDDWWVVSPDGDGLTWRCRWVPIADAATLLVPAQRHWLDAGRTHLDASRDPLPTPRPRPPLPPELRGVPVWESFYAPPRGGRRFAVAVTDDEPDRCTRGHGLCVTDDGLVVVIRDADGRWELPGGGREPGETTVDAFVREVEEEACATVTAVAVVCTLRIVELDEHGAASSAVDVHAQLWARVEPAPWEPRFETTARRLVTPDEAVVITTFPHHTAALLDRAVSIDPALDWKPTTGADR